jgi:type VI protein secretion system component VasK
MAGPSDRGDIPVAADVVALLGTLLTLFGAFMVSIWLVWLSWETYAWWSGLIFIGAGIALFSLAAVGAWLHTTGVPAARARWHEWRLKRERRAREAQADGEQ